MLLLICVNELFLVLQETCVYGTIIQTEITSKKIPCYMRDSACRWFIFKKAKAANSWSSVIAIFYVISLMHCAVIIDY